MSKINYSPYFAVPKVIKPKVKLVPVPPAHILGMMLFKVANKDLPIHMNKVWTAKGLRVHVNARALRSYYASRRKKRKPVTYEMRWELAFKQVIILCPFLLLFFLN